jgi:hypothetical protein
VEGLGAIGSQQVGVREGELVRRLWVDGHEEVSPLGFTGDDVQKFWGKRTLGVVGQYDGLNPVEGPFETFVHVRSKPWAHVDVSIVTAKLLVTRHNPCLHDGGYRSIRVTTTELNTVFHRESFENTSIDVVANVSPKSHRRLQVPNIQGHIGGPSQTVRVALHGHDRDRGLGRNPIDVPENIVVEHHVADD